MTQIVRTLRLYSSCTRLTQRRKRNRYQNTDYRNNNEQLNAWATGHVDLEAWNKSLLEHYSIVAVDNGIIVGFGDIDQTGYLDRLYVHADYQGRGIATAICNKLEQSVSGKIVTHASVTAKPFFEKRGYKVIKEQSVERHGVFLTNFVMEKAN